MSESLSAQHGSTKFVSRCAMDEICASSLNTTLNLPSTPCLEQNRQAWDERVARGDSHTDPARDRDFDDPLAVADECGWLGGNVRGQRVLCLAAGGGKHSVLFAAAGAVVTVVDI